ncbi:MAG: beta-propeller domain-containing protein, partial [Myxococcota bacterium]|nr:beta-propeller domain-containing protein [Myxococcota bacterium]
MRILTKFATFAALMTTTACDKKEEITELGPELSRFENCSETQDYMAEVMLEAALSYQYSYYWGWGGTEDVAAEADSGSSSENTGPSDYSTTNVQEEGVDEIDLVKTDGQYIYVAQDKGIHIVDSWPVEESHKLATIDLEGWARGLFLKGDQLIVFENIYNNSIDGFNSYSSVRINIIDVSDRSNPVVSRQIDIDGYLRDGRMIGEDVYAVVNHWSSLPQELWELVYNSSIELPEVDWSLSEDELQLDLEQKRAEAANILRGPIQELAKSIDVEEMLPKWRLGAEKELESIHSCENLYRPSQVSQFNVLSLIHLDLEDGQTNTQGLLSDGWTMYASQDNLYVAQSGQ